MTFIVIRYIYINIFLNNIQWIYVLLEYSGIEQTGSWPGLGPKRGSVPAHFRPGSLGNCVIRRPLTSLVHGHCD